MHQVTLSKNLYAYTHCLHNNKSLTITNAFKYSDSARSRATRSFHRIATANTVLINANTDKGRWKARLGDMSLPAPSVFNLSVYHLLLRLVQYFVLTTLSKYSNFINSLIYTTGMLFISH